MSSGGALIQKRTNLADALVDVPRHALPLVCEVSSLTGLQPDEAWAATQSLWRGAARASSVYPGPRSDRRPEGAARDNMPYRGRKTVQLDMPQNPAEDPSETPRLDMDRVALASFMLSGKGTPFYNAARELADQTIGHADDCEWHSNGHGYCSCPAYGAACARVDATFEALIQAESPDGHA